MINPHLNADPKIVIVFVKIKIKKLKNVDIKGVVFVFALINLQRNVERNIGINVCVIWENKKNVKKK